MRDARPRPPLWWLFADTFRTEPFHLLSPLSGADARRALADVGLGGATSILWGNPLYGRVTGNRVVARTRSLAFLNSRPSFFGELVERPGGVELIGELRADRYARVFNGCWVVLLVALGLAPALADARLAVAAVSTVTYLAIGSGSLHLEALFHRRRWQFLRDTLRDALDAADLTDPAGVPPV